MNRDGEYSEKNAEFSGFAASAKYVVGVDLGTSNCELAYLPVDGANDDEPRVLEIPQFVATSTIERRDKLPSALYVGPEEERGLADWRLPWNETSLDGDAEAGEVGGESGKDGKSGKGGFFRKIFGIGANGKADAARPSGTSNPNALYLVGEIALRRAAETPERTVVSAKSWLTHSRVDRREPILPWGAPDGTSRVSPVEASRRYLAHLAAAWNDAFPDAPIFEQQVVLTVPASFDESARELTREAAVGAGFNPETLIFLEEPSAAAYAWLAQKGNAWRKELAVGDVALVCDVGGGTTDLSLIRVEEEGGDLVLNRLAVGNRLLLGGDNVDLALAHRAAALFAEKGTKLNPWQAGSLWRQCRDAKETLLGGSVAQTGKTGENGESSEGGENGENARVGEEPYKITALGRSSQLVGGSVSVDFPKAEATAIVLDGFFPICALEDRLKRRSGAGLREAGLPFEADAAVTRHVAAFLNSRTDDDGAPIRPTRYLLNGGVFKSKAIAERFEEQLRAWFPDAPPTNLNPDADLDRAVARGAAFYGLAKRRGGIRIRGASARSYYIGIESAGLAIPGVPRPMKALCVAPVGMEEGTELAVPSDEFELVVGEPAVFRFFGSTTRPQDRPGTLLDLAEDDGDLLETDPIETALEAPESDGEYAENGEVGGTNGGFGGVEYVATRFRTVVTELGALEIWCEEVDGPRRWKLEFSVRED
ncbi:MAG: Hsp70 family protein [Thermoguttaceae bacterium]|nr:Hsp70 family protein [Thermoguttaceae bacterium]